MTDKEMAEEYVCNKANKGNFDLEQFGKAYFSESSMKQAYLAGLKAGKDMAEADLATVAYMQGAERYKPKWHKVADGDYPPCEKGNYTINVLTDCGDIAYYNYSLDCWIVEPSSAEIDPPIAWCEIPKFEKDEDYRKARKETLHDGGFQQGVEFGYNKGKEELEKENTELRYKVCELEDKIKMYENSYDEFCAEQIQRKGYVCPGNLWNPELRDMSASELCPACEHYKNDCIVYGKKKGTW